ncbi:hypothetical protein O988_08988 [Pseudogymnoascus sp. VKM F-3808]|nr:hypothetical protein O988_08988 [Pseudogymnoascus sp. VKM F-3808]
MSVDNDVVIVGAGPVGLTSALLLQKMGHRVRVYERHAQQYAQPRAVFLTHQAIRMFRALGVLDRMMETQAVQDLHGRVSDVGTFVDAEGRTLSEQQLNSSHSKSGTAGAFAIYQPGVEEVLEETCQERGVQVHRSTEVRDIVDLGRYMEISIAKLGNDKATPTSTNTVTAFFVVGCDGAKSIVRGSSKMGWFEYEAASSRWLVVDIIPTVPGAMSQWKDNSAPKQILDPKRPRSSVPSQLTRRRFEFMVLPNESTEIAMTDGFVWKMVGLFDCRSDTAAIERRTVYSICGGWAESFAKGRMALAGDAAHLAPQFLGQGLNSGLRDAKSMAWRLDFALRHPEKNWSRIMSDYSTEQLGITKQFVIAAKAIEHLIAVSDPEEAEKRDAMFRGGLQLPRPNLERVGTPGMHLGEVDTAYPPSCEPGTLFIQDKIEKDGKIGFFDKVVGDGWVLIANETIDLAAAMTIPTREAFSKLLGGHLVNFSVEGGYGDVSGRYKEWFSDSNVVAVLVRPDYYIYGTADTQRDIEAVVRRAIDYIS